MMKIKVTDFSYRGEGLMKQLIVAMSIEGSKTVESTAVRIDLYNISYFAERINEIYSGLFLLSAEVYAIDRAISRNKDSINGWTREIDVEFKVPCAAQFQLFSSDINHMLSFLTGDYWSCSFEESPTIEWCRHEKITDYDEVAQVNLFSGGMDSLIGAIDYMEANDEHHKVFLASHYDSIMKGPKTDQERIIEMFKQKYPGKFVYLPAEGITPMESKELTCRSRSFMFLSIAMMIAAYKSNIVIVPENGPVSLNFPLSASRRAACSTRTTHPLFIQNVRDLLSNLGLPIIVNNPYEFKTKGEMVNECKNLQYLLSIVDKSNSCGKRGGHQFMPDNPRASHCGRCMPCMYRKASLIHHKDPSTYGIKMQTLFTQTKKISNDFYAMLNFLKKDLSTIDIANELLVMGIKKSNPHFDDYICLVERTREELKDLLKKEANASVKRYVGLI